MHTHVTELAYPPHTSYTHAYTYHMHMHTHVTGHAHKGSYNMHMHLGGDFEMLVRARRVKFVSRRFQEMAAHAHAYTHAIGYAYTHTHAIRLAYTCCWCHTCVHMLCVTHVRDTRALRHAYQGSFAMGRICERYWGVFARDTGAYLREILGRICERYLR
jgi:hypothetical protein